MKVARIVVVLLASAPLVACSSDSVAAPRDFQLFGIVFDTLQNPVPNVQVEVYPYDSGRRQLTTTGMDGSYSIRVELIGAGCSAWLSMGVVGCDGCLAEAFPCPYRPTGEEVVHADLHLLPAAYEFTGRVYLEGTTSPAAGVEIQIVGPFGGGGEVVATTDADGAYTFSSPPSRCQSWTIDSSSMMPVFLHRWMKLTCERCNESSAWCGLESEILMDDISQAPPS